MVGRIAGIISYKDNELRNYKRMRISHIDFIDDLEVSRALVREVASWAKEEGMTELHGPLGFSDMDKEGMLLEGYEERSLLITIYNFPYYVEHFEKLGFEKSVDWVEYRLQIPEKQDERFSRIAEMIKKRLHVRLLDLKKPKDVMPYIDKIFDLLDEAYKDLYGTVPLNAEQRKAYKEQFFPLLNMKFVPVVVDESDDVVAFGLAVPSMAKAMQKNGGRLFPFGFLPVLKALKKAEALDLYLVAVKPELQGKGLNAILIDYVLKNAQAAGVPYAETGPELELNEKVQAQWKSFERQLVRRRRCWIIPVDKCLSGN